MLSWWLLALLVGGASGQTTETTAVQGDVPADLAGRWLVVEQSRLPTGMVSPFARLWEIRRGPEHLELIIRRARLPESLGTKLAAAASANRPWAPDAGDLRELAGRWDDLPATSTEAPRVEHRLVGRDGRPPDVEQGAAAGGAGVVIVTERHGSDAAPVKVTRSVYTVRD